MVNLDFVLSTGCSVEENSIAMDRYGFAYCSNFKLMDMFNNGNNNMTVEIYYKYTERTGYVFGTGTAGGFSLYGEAPMSSGGTRSCSYKLAIIANKNNQAYTYSYTNKSYYVASWYGMSFVFKTDSVDWYLNGNLLTTIGYGLFMKEGWGLGVMCNPINASGGVASSDNIVGNVAAFRVYDRALTSAEVISNYNKDKERFS